jgi:hypothetical protein
VCSMIGGNIKRLVLGENVGTIVCDMRVES